MSGIKMITIPSEIVNGANTGESVTRVLPTKSYYNKNLLKRLQFIIESEGSSLNDELFQGLEAPSIEKLKTILSSVLIRFDNDPNYYTKEDYGVLIWYLCQNLLFVLQSQQSKPDDIEQIQVDLTQLGEKVGILEHTTDQYGKALEPLQTAINSKQDASSDQLDTDEKTVIGAINELAGLVKTLESDFAYLSDNYITYTPGDSINIDDGEINTVLHNDIYSNTNDFGYLKQGVVLKEDLPLSQTLNYIIKGEELKDDFLDKKQYCYFRDTYPFVDITYLSQDKLFGQTIGNIDFRITLNQGVYKKPTGRTDLQEFMFEERKSHCSIDQVKVYNGDIELEVSRNNDIYSVSITDSLLQSIHITVEVQVSADQSSYKLTDSDLAVRCKKFEPFSHKTEIEILPSYEASLYLIRSKIDESDQSIITDAHKKVLQFRYTLPVQEENEIIFNHSTDNLSIYNLWEPPYADKSKNGYAVFEVPNNYELGVVREKDNEQLPYEICFKKSEYTNTKNGMIYNYYIWGPMIYRSTGDDIQLSKVSFRNID